jgi:DNA invertase Pin-like site-specific DNA recombinase
MSDHHDKQDLVLAPRRTAAMYVRMSTDHQKYSTENQADAIREYAQRHHMDIITTYTDAGKSGLRLDGRDALKQLIDDVQSGQATFQVILVLDVTRWGRFQDADESAYYEYICRRAGMDVRYVAEQFENDGSPVSTIVKGVKRAMAGEYSRELSAKVFTGQCRLIELGYRQGGPAGYGLRRVLVNEQGQMKATLKRGEHKSLQTDRVVLVPGPPAEVDVVRWIYRMFTEQSMQEAHTAALLNQRGVVTDLDRAWTRGTVHEILTNEKYIGNNVFNKTSFKLKKRHVANPPDMWVRADGVFEAIVSPSAFYVAQGIIRERSRKFTNDDLLQKLKLLHDKHGWLSGVIINETEDMPSSSIYTHRFGSLIHAYELIGYTPDRDYRYIEINRRLRQIYANVVEDAIGQIKGLGAHIHREVNSDLLYINNEIKVSMIICRCYQTKAGMHQWKLHFDSGLEPDITVAIRMDASNTAPLDYYLLPALDIEQPHLRLREQNSFALDAYRFDDLQPFFMMTERTHLQEVI